MKESALEIWNTQDNWQSEFLSQKNKDVLHRIFSHKRVSGKLKIECGMQWLTLKRKELIEKDWGYMMKLSFWKAPHDFDGLQSKTSYHTLDCYHILQPYRMASFKDHWYKSYTDCLDEDSFKVVKEKDKFLCLVRQVERPFMKNGELQTYIKGNRVGEEIDIIDPEIVKVYPPSTDVSKIEIDWFSLYKIETQ